MTYFLTAIILFSLNQPFFNAETRQVEFIIKNDDQRQTVDVVNNGFIFSPPTFSPRDNVILTSWYQDEAMTIWHDFDVPITANLTLYAEWRYRGTSLSPATLRRSEEGQRFESNTMTLYFDLYEPLAYQVRYQWQSARMGEQTFDDIGGALTNTFSPYRNGTFQYRVEYKIPVYNNAGLVIGSIPYYSEPVIIEIYGQQTLFLPITLLTFGALIVAIVFFRRKRLVYYDVNGGIPILPSRFRVGEDTSLQPKAKKRGYRFQGWYLDPEYEIAFKGMRMPLKSMRLYAKYKRIQKKT
jgi:hypothetical protein